MSWRRHVGLLLVISHLGVVIWGATGRLPRRDRGPAARFLVGYARMTRADSYYGFFAPTVGAPHRARFILNDDQGKTWQDTLERNSKSEARLRLTGIVDRAFMVGTAQELPEWRRRLLQSWGATMFSRHPSAVSFHIVVEARDIPTMEEFRAGSRPAWILVYQAEVHRQAATDPEGNN